MNKSEIHTTLNLLYPIGLNEMDSVRLMNRFEIKYVFPVNILPKLLKSLSGAYKALNIDNLNIFPYHTTYLDTPDFLFFNQQVTGKLNRYKVRFRRYESSGDSFLEIKKKTNKNRTIKWRIENNSFSDCPDTEASSFINEYLPENYSELKPVLTNRFKRITLVGKEFNERLTIDFNLEFSGQEGKSEILPFLAIAELKYEKYACHSPLVSTMKQFGIRQNGFSKYCIGNAIVREMPRTNILKRNLLLINKIENEYN